jgi:hypothetical protein
MWITIVIVIALVVLILGLSRTKFEVRHEIVIAAPLTQVWQAVIDFESYKNWNTQLSYLGGKVQLHEKLHLKLAVEGATPYEFKPTVSYYKEGELFAWIAITGIPRVFDGEHFFELKDAGNGTVLLINREEYRGVLSLIMQLLPMMKLAPKGFEKMNEELKRYIENA